jgi:hypothetical protein
MEVEFGETKMFHENVQPSRTISSPYTMTVAWGCFSWADPFHWYSCREQFAEKFSPDHEGFFVTHQLDHGTDLAAFLMKTELILGLVNNIPERSKFSKTCRPYAMWIEPSPFWRNCRFRFSLLTILLRSGANYRIQTDNYEEALFSDDYARETRFAIKRFLFGHTQFVWDETTPSKDKAEKIAWRDYFANKTVEAVRQKLIMPADATAPKSVVGAGSIWN